MNSNEPSLHTIQTSIVELKGAVENHVNLTKERMDRHNERIERHSKEIYGEGEKEPGIKNNMTKVLLIQNASIWVLGVIGTGLIGLIINAAWNFFTKTK